MTPDWLDPAQLATPGIAHLLDHTLLRPEATEAEVRRVAEEGARLRVAAVCVNGRWVRAACDALAGAAVPVAAVVGFPLGAMATGAKALEAELAVAHGAGELDMVIPLGEAKAGRWGAVRDDVRAVVSAAGTAPVKAILETAALTPDEAVAAARAAVEGGAAFVKTSTGFHAAGGATLEAVALLRRTVGATIGVKASGGVRTLADALAMVQAGASRIGTSAAPAIVAALSAPAPLRDLLRAAARDGPRGGLPAGY